MAKILKVKSPSGEVLKFHDHPVDAMTVETFMKEVAGMVEGLPASFKLFHNSKNLNPDKALSLAEAGVLADSVLRVKLPSDHVPSVVR